MRTALLVTLVLPLAAGCDPCAGYDGTVVTDPLDLVGDEEVSDLQATVDEWLAAVGPDRVCVSEVAFANEPDGYALIMGPTWRIRIDPSASPVPAVRSSLCSALDQEEHLSDDLGVILESDRPEVDFLNGCFQGPPSPGWDAQVLAACGELRYDERERFLLDEVYVNAPVGRVDGDLALAAGTPVRGAGLANAYGAVPAGDDVAFIEREHTEGAEGLRVRYVDLATGEVTVPIEWTGTHISASLVGGDRPVLVQREGEVETAYLFDADGVVETVTLDGEAIYQEGVVSGETLYAYHRLVVGLTAVDLATGAVREIPLPTTEAPRTITVSGLVAVEGGLVAELLDAEIVTDGDATTIGVYGYTIARWDAATEEWTTLADDFHGSLHGTLADGRVLATLYAGSGHVFAAYDPTADALHVSDDVCAHTADVAFVAGGRPWATAQDGDDVLFTPWSY